MIILKHLSDHPKEYLDDFYNNTPYRIEVCPHCHSHKRLYLHGVYFRYVLWFENIYQIPIQRHLCIHCHRTVCILPDFCHPRFQLALPYLLKIIHTRLHTKQLLRCFQHVLFLVNRFYSNCHRLIEFFRIHHDPLIKFPESKHKKAIKLLKMVTKEDKSSIFAKRFFDHLKIGFMAL